MAHKGSSHENGAVEAHNGHLKDALEQALILRGSRDFPDLASYQRFVDEVVARRNAARRDDLAVELRHMQPLPRQRTTDFTEAVVPVLSTGGFWLRNVFYSAPAQLIGHRRRTAGSPPAKRRTSTMRASKRISAARTW